jgi:hypothetical protein
LRRLLFGGDPLPLGFCLGLGERVERPDALLESLIVAVGV